MSDGITDSGIADAPAPAPAKSAACWSGASCSRNLH